jgi:hypothetical protein
VSQTKFLDSADEAAAEVERQKRQSYDAVRVYNRAVSATPHGRASCGNRPEHPAIDFLRKTRVLTLVAHALAHARAARWRGVSHNGDALGRSLWN